MMVNDSGHNVVLACASCDRCMLLSVNPGEFVLTHFRLGGGVNTRTGQVLSMLSCSKHRREFNLMKNHGSTEPFG